MLLTSEGVEFPIREAKGLLPKMPLDRIACYCLLLLKGYVSVTISAGLWY